MTIGTVVSTLGVQSLAVVSIAMATETGGGFFDNPTEYEFFPILLAVALVGAAARLLMTWNPQMPWPNRIGFLLSGMFAGFLFALAGWGRISPSLNMFAAGLAAYWCDKALVYLAREQYGSLESLTGRKPKVEEPDA